MDELSAMSSTTAGGASKRGKCCAAYATTSAGISGGLKTPSASVTNALAWAAAACGPSDARLQTGRTASVAGRPGG
jgi:hypothetical protein